MIYRRLDANGDYTFGANGNCYLSGVEAVSQAIATRLKLLKYEWWEDLDDGLPLWQQIIAQRDKEAAEREIQDRISQTPHVINILAWNADWDNENRSLSIYAAVNTEYGTLEVNEVMN
ncbi:hypothetical protein [Megasphaera sp.]|uniref:hypothetical protein n=1 Tax=Megasphaera sp. TaxID=2023260 RepID=UPI003FEE54D2